MKTTHFLQTPCGKETCPGNDRECPWSLARRDRCRREGQDSETTHAADVVEAPRHTSACGDVVVSSGAEEWQGGVLGYGTPGNTRRLA
ncbi:hypothetical protein J6590_004623 [Homalodisca vitripennis]|nr:hypothetical protein J6590_004623 [Homalodisca vitripennis]